ncbi:carboxymuconolactone decarboxylase family protein [Nakamurella lactea]|uniref:carboxymuconolactone decarboxylase family protein n=1 Tax=Nakamurella lactea TaxID=459515 RepID=UPI0004291CFC|nr:carboxymuconolactone decarboxylase family protein [Nakamurella lactea]
MTTTTHPHFPELTPDTAPESIRPTLQQLQGQFGGTVPPAAARLANSPELLSTFLAASAAFEGCSLAPLARETLIMTVAVRNGCRVCIQLHTGILRTLQADPQLIESLRAGSALADPELAALQRFTHQVMDNAGAVTDEQLVEFAAHGFGSVQALEVVLGVGAYTLSTFGNRMVGA